MILALCSATFLNWLSCMPQQADPTKPPGDGSPGGYNPGGSPAPPPPPLSLPRIPMSPSERQRLIDQDRAMVANEALFRRLQRCPNAGPPTVNPARLQLRPCSLRQGLARQQPPPGAKPLGIVVVNRIQPFGAIGSSVNPGATAR